MENQEKRLYTLAHSWLKPINQGIQTLHSTVEMFNKYVPNPGNNEEVSVNDNPEEDAYGILFDWSLNHKTVISLNPGVSGDLEELIYLLQDPENFYPWSTFEEDDYSLKGVTTAISIVLPEKIYTTASHFRTRNFEWDENLGRLTCLDASKADIETLELLESYGKFNNFEMELVQILGMYRLAS